MNSIIRNLVQEELELQKSLKRGIFSHPYYGLKDAKGYLTRYPNENLVLTRDEVETILYYGGGFDSYAHYGENPYGAFPEKGIHGIPWEDLKKYNLRTPEDRATYHKGWKIINLLKRVGIFFQNPMSTAERFSTEDIADMLTKNNTKGLIYLPYDMAKSDNLVSWEALEPYFNEAIKNPRWIGKAKFFSRRRNTNGYTFRGKVGNVIMSLHIGSSHINNYEFSSKIEEIQQKRNERAELKRARYVNQDYAFKTLDGRVLKVKGRGNTVWTSVGNVSLIEGRIYFLRHNSRVFKPVSLKKYGDVFVTKIENLFFVFPSNEDILHYEGKTLKEALAKYQRAQNAKSGVLTLRFCYEEKGYCWSGMRNFLQQNTPFLFRLVRKFELWEQVPADLKDQVWDVDPSIFTGSYNPTR